MNKFLFFLFIGSLGMMVGCMIRPAVDSLSAAIGAGNQPAFNHAFMVPTTFCNNCHRATKHEFNVIKVPDTPPFTNQVFTKQP